METNYQVMLHREIIRHDYAFHAVCYRSSRYCYRRCAKFRKGKPYLNCVHKGRLHDKVYGYGQNR